MSKVTKIEGYKPTSYAREASDMGWVCGYWPAKFTFEGKEFFRVRFNRDNEGELTDVEYESAGGTPFRVFND